MDFIKKHYKRFLVSLGLAFAVAILGFYFFIPALNFRSPQFYIFILAIIVAGVIPWFDKAEITSTGNAKGGLQKINFNFSKKNKVLLGVCSIPLVVVILGSIFSSTFFFAKSYANVIEVKESQFEEDMPEATEITNIALMDTESATKLGNKTLGSLSHVVSQYRVSPYYTQINYKGSPKKVSNLEYDDVFKWISNSGKGIPGMIMVDPVKSDAEYIEFKEPMYYAESGFLHQDLMRKLRFSHPTKIFGSVSFEVDENGQPFYIVSCIKPKVSLFGAKDINEVIIFNPCNGKSEVYKVEDCPTWCDIVYDGYLACEKYNWQGTLSGGFWNSIIGNKNCKKTTDNFGYIALDDDVWYYTGVTSVTADDKSNIGFILSNARTGEYKFYPVKGSEEHSAMASAEGEVQEKGYKASFPSLVNISGQPTYIMVLKDAEGLVKLYALVNVGNYSIVATGTTQTAAMSEYKKQLQQSGITIGGNEEKTADIVVEDVRIAMVSGVSTVYITGSDGNVYKGYLEADESLILIKAGDKMRITYLLSDIDKIFIISKWEFKA